MGRWGKQCKRMERRKCKGKRGLQGGGDNRRRLGYKDEEDGDMEKVGQSIATEKAQEEEIYVLYNEGERKDNRRELG